MGKSSISQAKHGQADRDHIRGVSPDYHRLSMDMLIKTMSGGSAAMGKSRLSHAKLRQADRYNVRGDGSNG